MSDTAGVETDHPPTAALPALTEDEHQALDLLEAEDAGEGVDAAELAAARARAGEVLDRFVPAVASMILRAVPEILEAQRAHLDHRDRVLTAVERVAAPELAREDAELAWLGAIREVPLMALLQDDANASALAGAALIDHLGARLESLNADTAAAIARVAEDPARAWSFSPAITATIQLLAIPRESMFHAMLEERVADEREEPGIERVGRVVTRWNRAAYLPAIGEVAPDAEPARACARELVQFRLASLRDANNEARARALAGDLPARIDLARVVAKRELEPGRAIRAFAAAVEAATAAERQVEQAPGRRFTRLHLTLLVILLALTAWHYWLR